MSDGAGSFMARQRGGAKDVSAILRMARNFAPSLRFRRIPSEKVALMSDLASMDGAALLAAYRNRVLSPREAVADALERAEKANARVNAFALIDREGALAAARDSEERWIRGKPLGILDGLPCTIKDAINWAGHP